MIFGNILRRFLNRYAIGESTVDYSSVLSSVNALSSQQALNEAEQLIGNSKNWNYQLARHEGLGAVSDLGPMNLRFFEKYDEVQSQFMSLQISYLARPDWLPESVAPGCAIVGHTVEQEYLFCRKGSDEVFVLAIDDPQNPNDEKFASIAHAIIYYERAFLG